MPLGPSSRQLSYFMEVLRAGSVRGAADACNVEPSVVSRQVAALEADLGVSLLERRGRGVVPTEAAELVLAYCRDRVAGNDTLRTQLLEIEGLKRGRLHLMVGDGFVDTVMRLVVGRFCSEFPGVEVTVEVGGTSETVRALAEDRCDLGLALSPPTSSAIHVVSQRAHPICALMAPDHPCSRIEAPLTLALLQKYPLALAAPGTGLRTLIQSAADDECVELRPSFVSNTVMPMKHYAEAGLGLTFLSAQAAATELADGRLIARPIANSILQSSRVQLIVRDRPRLSPALTRLIRTFDESQYFSAANDPLALDGR